MFVLHYVDPTGDRVENLAEPFDSLDEAREEATLNLEDFVGGGTIASPMGSSRFGTKPGGVFQSFASRHSEMSA